MKRLIKTIFVLSVAVPFLVSCASTTSSDSKNQKKDVAVQDSSKKEEIEKKVTATTKIARLIADGNIEGAYYRMSDNFRFETPYSVFQSEWQKVAADKGNVVDFSVDSSEYDTLSFYKNIKVVFKMDTGNVIARYLYNSTNIIPADVSFSDSAETIADEIIPLKELCKDYFKIGCGITGATAQGSAIRVPDFMNIVKEQFSSCTSTNLMKPAYVLNQNQSMKNAAAGKNEPFLEYSNIDKTLQWCMENGVALRGHTLVWHTQTPEWFFREGYKNDGKYVSRNEMIERLDSFICQYLTYVQENYPGVVYCWDVVNEAVDPDKGDSTSDFMCRKENDNQPNGWYMTIGKDYPEVAFTIARKYAAKDVKLFYNDYGTISRRKSELIYTLCKSLKDKGLIDGIGMQGYWDYKNPSLKDIEEIINKYAELGLELQLTEWSIPARTETVEGFNEQAERYASVFKLLQRLDTQGGGKANITCVSFFGVQDRFVLNPNDKNNTRLYDHDFNPKPVYYSIQDVFKLYY